MFSELPEVGGDLLAGGVCFEKHSLEAASEVNLFKFWTIFKKDEIAVDPREVFRERGTAPVHRTTDFKQAQALKLGVLGTDDFPNGGKQLRQVRIAGSKPRSREYIQDFPLRTFNGRSGNNAAENTGFGVAVLISQSAETTVAGVGTSGSPSVKRPSEVAVEVSMRCILSPYAP